MITIKIMITIMIFRTYSRRIGSSGRN